MRRLVLMLLPLVLPLAAGAQTRPFSCVGAEQLEDDVFALPFAKGAAAPGEAARANLDAAAALAGRETRRNLCVLGHAAGGEGAALAARRAAAVAQQLGQRGIAAARIRAEARRASFARGIVPAERSVTIVVMPGPTPARRPTEPR